MLMDSVHSEPSTRFLTGRKLELHNQQGLTVTWGEIDLRTRLTRFARSQKVGVFLDRRLDSQANDPIELKNMTYESILWTLANESEASVCKLENLYYIGPKSVVGALPNVVQDAKSLIKRQKSKFKVGWHRTARLRTKELVEPRELLKRIAEENKFEFENLEVIPHDIWLGMELPPMSLAQLVQVLIAGFNKQLQWNHDGTQVKLVDLASTETIGRRFRFPPNVRSSMYQATISTLKRDLSKIDVKRTGSSIQVEGPTDEVLEFETRWVALQVPKGGNDRVPNSNKKDVFTLNRVTASRLDFLKNIASQLEYQLKIETTDVASLNERIMVDVKNVVLVELLNAVSKNSSLKISTVENSIVVK